MSTKVTRVINPLVIMFQVGDKVETHIHAPDDYDFSHYALLACDLVRNVAGAFGVSESAVWEVLDRERASPTTDVRMKVVHGKVVQ
jgi:hypothetical protein